MPRIFVSQRRVQQWTEEGRVAVDGNIMNLPELGRTFRLTEAFFVERVVSEGGDAYKLTGRVKTRSQIAALGGEVFLNSLIIGDAAYEGDPGFVGEAIAAAKTTSTPPASPQPPAAPAPKSGRRDAVSQQGVASGVINVPPPAAPAPTAATPGGPSRPPSSRDKSSILGVGPGHGGPGLGQGRPGPEAPRKNS